MIALATRHSPRLAFTLVELSIVLVILGLLVGGILSGQSLIRAAELRSVTTQYQKYIAATNTFKDKYFALPGDMNNAQAFWGVAHATPATCVTTAGTGTQTCNGDGDGQVYVLSAGSNESFRFWQHLASAGLIEGQYDGVTHGATSYSGTLANSPAGRMSSSLWTQFYWSSTSPNPGFQFDMTYGNTLIMGGMTANNLSASAIFRPEEMWNIDTKIDDGKPGMGKLVAFAWSNLSTCTTAVGANAAMSAATNSDYLLTSTSLVCSALFPRAF